jgi:hypothetical protein
LGSWADCQIFLNNIRIQIPREQRVERTARAFSEGLYGVDAHEGAVLTVSADLLDKIPDEPREQLLEMMDRMAVMLTDSEEYKEEKNESEV